MKRLIFIALLLGLAHKSDAMDTCIKLPSQQELNARLCSFNLQYFADKTKIHEQLGGKEIKPLEVLTALEQALCDYQKVVQNPVVAEQMQCFKPIILKAFLREHLEATDFLMTCLRK